MKGVDFSWARPGGAAIKAAGFEFCMRYVPYPGDGGKGLTADEIADYRTNGLGIGLVFESTGGRVSEGGGAGIADAHLCEECSALGFPSNRPFFFAVDFDMQPADYPVLDAYLQGAASVLGANRVGVYGSYAVVEHCRQASTAAWLWQTYAWSGGQRSDYAHVYQYNNGQTLNGGAVDWNVTLEGVDVGIWTSQEDEMDPEDKRRLDAVYYTMYGGDPAVETDYLARQIGIAQSITSMEGALNRLADKFTGVDQNAIADALIAAGNELKAR